MPTRKPRHRLHSLKYSSKRSSSSSTSKALESLSCFYYSNRSNNGNNNNNNKMSTSRRGNSPPSVDCDRDQEYDHRRSSRNSYHRNNGMQDRLRKYAYAAVTATFFFVCFKETGLIGHDSRDMQTANAMFSPNNAAIQTTQLRTANSQVPPEQQESGQIVVEAVSVPNQNQNQQQQQQQQQEQIQQPAKDAKVGQSEGDKQKEGGEGKEGQPAPEPPKEENKQPEQQPQTGQQPVEVNSANGEAQQQQQQQPPPEQQQPPSGQQQPQQQLPLDKIPQAPPQTEGQPRPIMNTFFEKIPDEKKGTQMSDEADNKLIQTWKDAWYAAGWEPRVLSLLDAKMHPKFEEYSEELKKIPMMGVDGLGSNIVYNQLCFLRWLAMAASGGGYMSDYDVFPLQQTPMSTPDTFTVFSVVKGSQTAGIPCLMGGEPAEWTRMAYAILENGIKAAKTETMWSDMFALIDMRKDQAYAVQDAVVEGQDVLLDHPWTLSECAITKDKKAVHMSHEALTKGHTLDGETFEDRPLIVNRFLSEWRPVCQTKDSGAAAADPAAGAPVAADPAPAAEGSTPAIGANSSL